MSGDKCDKDDYSSVPGPHLGHLISHLAKGLGGAQNISSLLPSAQLTHFASFIQDLPYGLLTLVPLRCNTRQLATSTYTLSL